jgi:hypothetical protein
MSTEQPAQPSGHRCQWEHWDEEATGCPKAGSMQRHDGEPHETKGGAPSIRNEGGPVQIDTAYKPSMQFPLPQQELESLEPESIEESQS